jgi:GMP reductase
MEKYLTYDDILLVPNYSELETRSGADTSVELCGRKFKLPIMPANMQDVINTKLAYYLSENGYFYIMHRFGIDMPSWVESRNIEDWKLISISTGVNNDSLEELIKIKAMGYRVDFITIDVAHGNHIKVKNRIRWIKDNLPNTKIIAGNVADFDGYWNLMDWGADVVKMGVGQGSICTTRFQTGFSVPMFSCVDNIKESIKNQCLNRHMLYEEYVKKLENSVPIIADGSIKYYGDIAKALVAGATMVMSGKLFASCIDSPAEIIDGKKQYRGSTSFAAKKINKHIEGKIVELDANTSIGQRLDEIKQALQSSISYAGGKDLSAFKNVKWIKV